MTTTATPEHVTRPPVSTKRMLRYEFNNPEKIRNGRDLADAMTRASQVESDLTRVKTDFKARLSALEAEMHSLRDKINSGFELREIECEWRFDQPKLNQKALVRLDTDEVVEVAAMTDAEKQAELPLETAGDDGTSEAEESADPESNEEAPPPIEE